MRLQDVTVKLEGEIWHGWIAVSSTEQQRLASDLGLALRGS